jgi:hypothetical protein
LVMAWSPPAHSAGIVWVSAPGDYATFNSNHTPERHPGSVQFAVVRVIQFVERQRPWQCGLKIIRGPLMVSSAAPPLYSRGHERCLKGDCHDTVFPLEKPP